MQKLSVAPLPVGFPLRELLVGVALLVAVCTSIVLTRVPGGIALFWPGSAIAATFLIRLERVRWPSAIFFVVIALLLSNALVAHRPWLIATGFACEYLLEIALMVAAFRFLWRYPYPHLSINQAAFMVAVLGVAIPGATTAIAALFLYRQFSASWVDGTWQWWSSHTVGACLLGPPIILFSVKGFKRLVQPSHRFQNALIFAGCLIGSYLAIRYVRFPFVSMGMLLLVAAFQLGGLGASLMSLSVGLLITNLWIIGVRPLGLDPGLPSHGSLLGLPVIAFLATVIPPIAVGLGSDARRDVARALKVSERRFRESMEHSPIGMLISDLDGTWGYTNRALQKMLGYTAEQFRAMPPGGPSTSDDWRDSESRWSRLLAGEIDSYEVARSFRHHDGSWVWTHVAVSLLRDEERAPLHLIAQIESLEARKLAEATLAAERERLKTTLRSISDAVLTTDASLHITYANAAAESLLRIDLAAMDNRRVDEVMHLVDPETSKTADDLIARSAHHVETFRRENPCLLHRADGSIVYATDVVSPVLDSNGALTGLVIVLRDATADLERSRDLRHQALHDPLTGLSNRAHFNERLSAIFHRTRQSGEPAAIIAIDLDWFKAVNDSAGHAAGDAVLCKVAEACRNIVRTSDTVARLGGDEFAIILDNCPEARATWIAQQLLAALNPVILKWGNVDYTVNASLGLAMQKPGIENERAWTEAADQACYYAKRQGRSRLEVAEQISMALASSH